MKHHFAFGDIDAIYLRHRVANRMANVIFFSKTVVRYRSVRSVRQTQAGRPGGLVVTLEYYY